MSSISDECEDCFYYSKDVTEDPCFKCLSGYFTRPYFTQKDVKKKEKNDVKETNDGNTQLPWT